MSFKTDSKVNDGPIYIDGGFKNCLDSFVADVSLCRCLNGSWAWLPYISAPSFASQAVFRLTDHRILNQHSAERRPVKAVRQSQAHPRRLGGGSAQEWPLG